MGAFEYQALDPQGRKKKGIIETSVYCMNTKRKYIYELSGGVIVSERVIQCAD